MTPSIKTLNRFFSIGYIAKGTVYFLMGGLTLATVLGFSAGQGGAAGPRGILKWIENQPLGHVLVGLIGAGLLCYAAWRIYRGVADPHDEGHEPSSAIKRIGYVVSGLINTALAFVALRLALAQGGDSSGSSSKQSTIASILEQPWGPWLIGAVGAIVIGVGLFQVYKGYKADFVNDLSWGSLSTKTVRLIGRAGFYARGLVFSIIGYFLILTATQSQASEFKGTEGALEYLKENTYGLWLLGLTSAGLLLYGVFAILKGWHGSVRQQA